MNLNLESLNQFTISFLEYVVFRPWKDDDDESLVVCSQDVMHDLDASSYLIQQKRPEVTERLEDLQHVLRHILPFRIVPADYLRGRATCIRPEISPELGALVTQRQTAFLEEKGAVPLTLLPKPPLTKRAKDIARQQYCAAGQRASANVPTDHPLHQELKQLNSRKPHSFARLEKNRRAAADAARALPSIGKAIHNLDVLSTLPHFRAFYKATSGSPRLYTVQGGLQLLSKEVRQALFGEAIHFDLCAAQLAVVAKIWGVDGLQEKLGRVARDKAWSVVVEPMQEFYPDITKGNLKAIIYPLVFGMSKKKLTDEIQKECNLSFAKFFRASEIMQELLDMREDRKKDIKEKGYIVDAFGIRHKFAQKYDKEKKNKKYSNNLRRLMAYEAQSYEVALMKPAIQYALGKKYCSLDLLIHDGIVIRITEKKKREAKRSQREELGQFERGIIGTVDVKAKEFGILTTLAVEYRGKTTKKSE